MVVLITQVVCRPSLWPCCACRVGPQAMSDIIDIVQHCMVVHAGHVELYGSYGSPPCSTSVQVVCAGLASLVAHCHSCRIIPGATLDAAGVMTRSFTASVTAICRCGSKHLPGDTQDLSPCVLVNPVSHKRVVEVHKRVLLSSATVASVMPLRTLG